MLTTAHRQIPTRSTLGLTLVIALSAAPVASQEQASPVSIVLAQESPVYEELPLTGSLTARRVSALSPKVDGFIAALRADEGDYVQQGQVLAELDVGLAEIELARTAAAVEEGRARLADAERRRDEAALLKEKQHIAKSNYEAALAEVSIGEAALKRLRAEHQRQAEIVQRHRVQAPFDGVIGRKLAEVGQWVETGSPLFELVETGRLRIEVPVPQRYYSRLRAGTPAIVRFDAEPDELYEGAVTTKIPVGNPAARTFPIRIELDNRNRQKAPGMSARVVLKLIPSDAGTALILPRDAIIKRPDGSETVWRVQEEDGVLKVNPLAITTGRAFSGNVEIKSAELRPGDRVVVRGNEILQDGQRVRIVGE